MANQDLFRPEMWVAGLIGLAASAEDMARRTISNWLPIAALLGGLACQSMARGWRGAGSALLGAAGGFAVFLIFYVLGGMGGGDVKLMAGFGAILGIGRLLPAAMFVAMIGGAIALAVVCWSKIRRINQRNDGAAPAPVSIPYAPAIALGVCITLLAGS